MAPTRDGVANLIAPTAPLTALAAQLDEAYGQDADDIVAEMAARVRSAADQLGSSPAAAADAVQAAAHALLRREGVAPGARAALSQALLGAAEDDLPGLAGTAGSRGALCAALARAAEVPLAAGDAETLLWRVARDVLGCDNPAAAAAAGRQRPAAWRLAERLLAAARGAAQPARVERLAGWAVDLLAEAVRPLLLVQPPGAAANGGGGEGPAVGPAALAALASFATRAAAAAAPHGSGAAAEAAGAALLAALEGALVVAAALEPGGAPRAALLAAAAALAAALPRALAAAHAAPVQDALSALQPLLAAAARLAEADHAAARLPGGLPKVLAIYGWDLVGAAGEEEEPEAGGAIGAWPESRAVGASPAVLRWLVEAAAAALAAGWAARRGEAERALAPLAAAAPGDEAAALVLARAAALARGDAALLALALPLLEDGLAGAPRGAPPQRLAVAARALAAAGAAAAAAGGASRPAAGRVADLLVKLHKFPAAPAARALLAGGPRGGGAAAGALAHALEALAAWSGAAGAGARRDLRGRLLALFSDFGLILPDASYLPDLGGLLPAVAAACAGLGAPPASRSASAAAEMSLEALAAAQAADLEAARLFRHVWLYAAAHDFAGLRGGAAARLWPPAWRAALGRIAAATPSLLIGSEAQTLDALAERLEAEYGGRLARLGAPGGGAALAAAYAAAAGVRPAALPAVSAAHAAHLLTVAAVSLCQARHAPLAELPPRAPLAALLAYLEPTPRGAPHAAWLHAALDATFDAFLARLRRAHAAVGPGGAAGGDGSSRGGGGGDAPLPDAEAAWPAAEGLARTLAAALADADGGNLDVALRAVELLGALTTAFPGLRFSRAVLEAALRAVEEEDRAAAAAPPRAAGAPPRAAPAGPWALRLVARAAEDAPGPTEAAVAEVVGSALAVGGHAADAAARHMPRLLDAVREARGRFALAAVGGRFEGLASWSAKLRYSGRVSGLEDASEAEGAPPGAVAHRAAAELLAALRGGAPEPAVIDKYLTAAAAAAAAPPPGAAAQLLRLLCWAPAKQFAPAVVDAAAMAWHWLMAAAPGGGAAPRARLLGEVLAAWTHTRDAGLGLFSGRRAGAAGFEDDDDGDAGAAGSDAEHRREALVEGIRAHHLWLAFFFEVWRAADLDGGGARGAERALFARLLAASLADAGALSTAPAAAGARFRLLQLALQFCRAAARPRPAAAGGGAGAPAAAAEPGEAAEVALLYDRTLRAALLGFAAPPAWHAGDDASRREAVAAASGLLREVRRVGAWPASRAPPGAPHPVWPAAAAAQGNAGRHALLVTLLGAEVDRLAAWADPLALAPAARGRGQPPPAGDAAALSADQWGAHVAAAWGASPALALGLERRFPCARGVRAAAARLVARHARDPALRALPAAGAALARAAPGSRAAAELAAAALPGWAPLPLRAAVAALASEEGRHAAVRPYLARSLRAARPRAVAFFLPQLVQALRHDAGGEVEALLLAEARAAPAAFGYPLLCWLAAEGTPPAEALDPPVKRSGWAPPRDTGLWATADRVRAAALAGLPLAAAARLRAQLDFFGAVAGVSGRLYPVPKEERKAAAVRFARELAGALPRRDLFVPTDPALRVLGVRPESAAPMQSAAKCPVLLAFDVAAAADPEAADGGGGEAAAEAAAAGPNGGAPPAAAAAATTAAAAANPRTQALIFKVGDDCRQDSLALQVLAALRRAFRAAGLPLYVRPYGVVPTGYEEGVIEVVPRAKSRAQLGEVTEGGLLDVFRHEFGAPGSRAFEAARDAFVESCAGYAVASYILQAKDRHNGNIMVDNRGRLVHIDFGFILGISPGGNLGFESAAFKLSFEMTELLDPGAGRRSPTFLRFQALCVRGYLAARRAADEIVAAVAMCEPSGLPCFGRGRAVEALRARFHPELPDSAAAALVRGLIADAYDKWTTGVYDLVQKLQNSIPA